MGRVRSLYQLIQDAGENVTMPPEEAAARKREAAQMVYGDTSLSQEVKNDYGQKLETIFDNSKWTTTSKSGTVRGGRNIQQIYNVGLTQPTRDMDLVREQVVQAFDKYVRPDIASQCKVSVIMGTLMEYRGDEADGEPTNTKYFRPDFNSSVTKFPVAVGTRGDHPEGRALDSEELSRAMTEGGSLNPERPDSKYKLACFTNVMFRVHLAPMEPIVGAKRTHMTLPKKPIGFKRLHTPKRNDNLCVFECIRVALKRRGHALHLAKEYVARNKGLSLRVLRRCGLNAKRGRQDNLTLFRESLTAHAEKLEETFNIRLYIFAHDDDAHAERGQPKKRLSVLSLYSPRKKGNFPIVHLLLTNETPDDAPRVYTHAHLIKRPDVTLRGVRCALCNKSYARINYMLRHTCRLGPILHYPGGPKERQLTVWDKLDEEGIDVPRRRARHAIFWRADLDAHGNGKVTRVTATTNAAHFRMKDKPNDDGVFVWRGRNAVRDFYAWACHLQKIHEMWWLHEVLPMKSKVPALLWSQLVDYGKCLPCISMPADLRATVAIWGKRGESQILRSNAFYRSVVIAKDKLHFLNWTNYDTPDKKTWEDFFSDDSDHTECVKLLMNMAEERQRDLDDIADGSVELFRANVSLPHVSRYLGFKAAEEAGYAFYLPKGRDDGEEVEGLFHGNMTGGPSIVYQDRAVDGMKILTFDANSLYAWALSQDMPVGRRMFSFDRDKGFRVLGDRKASMGELAWIHMLRQEGHSIMTPEEYPTKRIRVTGKSGAKYIPDGINKKTRTVYEYLGDYWHGASEEKMKATEYKLEDMRQAGWTVVTVWEKDFKKAHPTLEAETIKRVIPPLARKFVSDRRRVASDRVMEFVLSPDFVTKWLLDDTLFGFVEVDVKRGEGHDVSDAFAPIFFTKDSSLRNGHEAEKILLHTPYAKCLLERGYKITKVHRVWEFLRGKPFKKFVDRAVEERLKKTRSADTWKLLVNSLYGGMIINKRKYTRTKTIDGDLKRGASVMDPSFCDMQHVAGGTVHVISIAGSVAMDNLSQGGKAVLDNSKVRIVNFYYDAVKRAGGRVLSTDTDAVTFFLPHGVKLSDILPPDVLLEYFDDPDDPERGGPKKRGTPGLFHLESNGTAARVVGPKMMCVTDGERATKVTCKGVKRCALPDNPFPLYADMCDGKSIPVEFDSMRHDDTTGAVRMVKMRRTMKRT